MSRSTKAGAESLFVSPQEAAALLGISRDKVYELCAAGELASGRLGSAIRIPRKAITDLCERIMAGK